MLLKTGRFFTNIFFRSVVESSTVLTVEISLKFWKNKAFKSFVVMFELRVTNYVISSELKILT